jgi:hypothetical protein
MRESVRRGEGYERYKKNIKKEGGGVSPSTLTSDALLTIQKTILLDIMKCLAPLRTGAENLCRPG